MQSLNNILIRSRPISALSVFAIFLSNYSYKSPVDEMVNITLDVIGADSQRTSDWGNVYV